MRRGIDESYFRERKQKKEYVIIPKDLTNINKQCLSCMTINGKHWSELTDELDIDLQLRVCTRCPESDKADWWAKK